MAHSPARVAALLVPLAGLLVVAGVAQACTIDGKASAFANGQRAVVSHIKLTAATAPTWASFTFQSRYRANTPIRLSEDRGQLRHVLPSDAQQRGWRWEFGDGTRADGWTVAHRYARPGAYRITVLAYYASVRQYLSIDSVRIVISR